ncbi:hypothetical protein Tco_1161081, partial [Tanacetum coccineum]
MLAIFNAIEPVVFKAPKPSSNVERVSQGIKPGAKPGHKKHSTSSKQPSMSSKEAIKGGSSKAPTSSKTGHSKKRKESSSGMDSNPSQPLVYTPVDTGMHKEDQQATGGPTSLGVTRNDASAVSTTELDPGKSASSDFIPQQQGMNEGTKNSSYDHLFVGTDPHVLADQTKSVSEGLETVLTQPRTAKGASSIARQFEEEEASSTIKLEDLAKLVSNVKPSFKDLDSPKDNPIIVVDSDEDEEDEVYTTTNAETKDTSNKAKAKAALLKAQPSFPNMGQLNELLVKSFQTEFLKILSAHDFSSSLPTELKDLPSKFNELTKEVKGLKKQVYELEIKLPGDLKEIPTKLEEFTKTVTNSASSKARDQSVPSADQADTMPAEGEKNTNQGEHIKKDKGKKAMSSKQAEKESTNSGSNDDDKTHMTGSMVESSTTKKLKKFDFITEDGKHIHLTEEQINQQKKIEKEAKAEVAKHEGEVRKEELVDLLGLEVVNKYYNDNLQYDRYCDKMLNRRAESRITNCDVLTKKGPITLKVYREHGTSEVIPNFKASDLHLGEWREVVKACPNRTGKVWKTIYGQIQTRMDYLYTTEAELGINLNIPLSEQDPLDKLNDLANKKRKHADDIHDYFKANKRLKSSIQYEDHLPGTVLNKPVLGIIMFNS